MKIAFRIVMFILCLNIASTIISSAGLLPEGSPMGGGYSGVTYSQIEGFMTMESTNTFYDYARGMATLWSLVSGVVAGFPTMLINLGAPSLLVGGVYTLFLFIWGVFVFELWTGREVTEDY